MVTIKINNAPMVPSDLRAFMSDHNITTVKRLAVLLGADEDRIHRFIKGQQPIPTYIFLALQALSARLNGQTLWEPPNAQS